MSFEIVACIDFINYDLFIGIYYVALNYAIKIFIEIYILVYSKLKEYFFLSFK